MNDKLESAKLLHLGKDDSYQLALGTLILDWLPHDVCRKVLIDDSDEPGDRTELQVFTRQDAIIFLGTTLSTLVPYDVLTTALNDIKYDIKTAIEEAFNINCIESIIDSVKNKRMELISEAETPEEVEVVSKSLSDMLASDKVPNILNSIAQVISKELKKSKDQLDKLEDSDNKVTASANADPDIDAVPFNPAFDGIGFGGEGEDEPVGDTEPNEGEDNKDGLETEEVNADIDGEDGEVYSESFRDANAGILSGNLSYFIKRAVSLNAYNSLKDTPELAEDPHYKARIILSTSGILIFGYALVALNLMTKEDYAKRVGYHLVPDECQAKAGEMHEINHHPE